VSQAVPPAGFQRSTSGRRTLIAANALAEPIGALGLLEPGALERCSLGQPGALGRTHTAVVPLAGAPSRLLLRRLVHGGLLGPLLRGAYWRMNRAVAELRVTDALHKAGAPVPRPGLAVGTRLLGPVHALTVGTVYEEGTVDLLGFLLAEPSIPAVLATAGAAGRAVRAFHDAGGRHADLHIKNVLVREGDGAPSCIVIDLDKARVTAGLTPGERMGQLMRLFRSLLKREVIDIVGARGCARFFASYCGDDRRLRRALWKRVPAELRLVALHKLRY